MKIAVVGATGPTGQLVVSEALKRGHQVLAYVRNPEKLVPRQNLEIVVGQLSDVDKFANAIKSSDVLISTLGNRSFKVRDFMRVHLPLVTQAMQKAGLNKLILMSALGGGQIPERMTGFSRFIFRLLSESMFVDRTISESDLIKTGINWAGVYPGFLSDDPPLKLQVADLNRVKSVSQGKVSRANVAIVLVDLAEDSNFAGKRLALAKKIKL